MAGSAVRRQRMLRSMWRHEQMAFKLALAEKLHHSACRPVLSKEELVEHAQYNAPRGQKTARAVGGRPAPLPEVAGWQGRLEQHVMEDLGSICPSVQILDLPLLEVVEQPEEVDSFFRNFVPAVAEQVIEVPKLALPGCAVQRAALSEPQTAEQLVEVPTVLHYSLLQQRTAEHFIGIAVPRRGGGARGGLQGLSQGQGSTAVSGADYVDTTVSGRGGGAHGGLHGLSQGQGSTAVSGAEHVVTPVPLGRGGGARGGLQGLSQGQGSIAVCGAENVDSPARGGLHGLSQGQGSAAVSGAVHVDTPARGGLHGLSQGQGSAAVSGADHVDIPVPHSRVGERGLHGFPREQGSTASAVEQTIAVDRLQGFTRGQSSTSRRGDALPLPSGWRRAEDAYGRVYYWHVHTRQTQFTPPASDDEDEDEEDEEEEDEDLDELDDTQSRFPAGFRPMRMCRWFPSAGVGVYVRLLGERAALPGSWTRAVTFLRPFVSGSQLFCFVRA